jgi:trehalose-6-phosphate synthase
VNRRFAETIFRNAGANDRIRVHDYHRITVGRELRELGAAAEIGFFLLGADLSRRVLILGVDRLDSTKGIPERLAAFGNALERFPQLREKISLVQVVVPSRAKVPKYRDLELDIDRLISAIKASSPRLSGFQFTTFFAVLIEPSWCPFVAPPTLH